MNPEQDINEPLSTEDHSPSGINPSAAIQPSEPIPAHNKTHKKFVSWLLVVLIVLCAAGGGIYIYHKHREQQKKLAAAAQVKTINHLSVAILQADLGDSLYPNSQDTATSGLVSAQMFEGLV